MPERAEMIDRAVIRFSPWLGKNGDQNQGQMGSCFRKPIDYDARRYIRFVSNTLNFYRYICYTYYISDHYEIVNKPAALKVMVSVSVSASVMLEP